MSDQDSQTTNVNLKALRRHLVSLQSKPLAPDAHVILQAALERLDAFDQHMAESEEQKQLAALYQVSRSIGTSLNLDEVLKQVMDAVIGLTEAERGFLMLADSVTGELTLRAARNVEQKTLQRADMKVSRTVIQTVVENAEGIVTTNAQNDPRFSGQESVIAFALRSILCSPLLSRGKVIGAIYVDNRAQAGLFTIDDLDLLNAFAAQAAAAIENARVYQRADENLADRIKELENLARVARELSQHLEFEHVVEITRKWALEGTQAEDAWLAIREQEGGLLRIAAGAKNGQILQPGDPIVSGALQAGTPHVFAPEGGSPARLVVPILANNQTAGVIVIEKPSPFSPEALQFATRLSNYAAIALDKARLYQDVQRVSDEKTKFVSVVTHELRTPMTSMKGYTDLLLQGAVGPINDDQTGFLNIIRKNVERMSSLVSDLADISRVESGRLLLEPSMISVHDYVEETLKSLIPNIVNKSQVLDMQVPQTLEKVYADPNRLVQILTNLVSNAWKYSPRGGRITVMASAEAGFVRIEVRDTGFGISAEDQQKLFTQFFRSEDANIRDELGWGLGLNVTKQLVEIMGGEIGVESVHGKGSTFWFTLPTQAPETTD
ncbi:MAG: GAF domain-containing protein [Anaerolineae bacterium]|nr:GAF domain-containing protein [Anaerolineae bacterium]